jgi:hypothetical protein
MPYVTMKRRNELNKIIELMEERDIKADGDLNYVLFAYAKYSIPASYNNYKNYIGELNETIAEIRRKILSPYEEIKEKENGPI